MVRLYLIVDLGGWEVEFTSEPMSENVAEILLMEMTRDPSIRVLRSRRIPA